MPLFSSDTMLNNHNKINGVSSMIKIFSKPNCPFCERAKQYLDNLDIQYDAIDITKNPMDHSFLVREGHRTVPQFYQDDNLTEIMRFNLYDSSGQPTETNVYKRERV